MDKGTCPDWHPREEWIALRAKFLTKGGKEAGGKPKGGKGKEGGKPKGKGKGKGKESKGREGKDAKGKPALEGPKPPELVNALEADPGKRGKKKVVSGAHDAAGATFALDHNFAAVAGRFRH